MTTGRRGEPDGLLDLRRLDLTPGAGAEADVPVTLPVVTMGGQPYTPEPAGVIVRVDVGSSGSGLGLRLRFGAALTGPCQTCLAPSRVVIAVDTREYQALGRNAQAAGDDDFDCEYLHEPARMDLDVAAWARDAMVEAIPMSIFCRPDCRGLCARCGADLNTGPCACGDDATDPRWAALEALRERLTGESDDPL